MLAPAATTEMPPSIADFLQMRAWKHALFTTYTLSLSYFESEILRPLVRSGCSDIWLIADAEGYRSSLLERRSMQVGQSYRLVPAALPQGVFHAKSIYLGSDDGDLLLVGSGNVTFCGHGRNAEVFEAISPDQHPQAFIDFADFLESVGSRPDIRIANSDWVTDFAARALRAADASKIAETEPALRLLHPMQRPILDQLRDLFGPLGACKSAKILSPYHDRDAYSVSQLVQQLNIRSIGIGVPTGGESPFPFADTRGWEIPPASIKPDLEGERFIHAKWYEFNHEKRSTLFTGSVNATRKALTTTDNVELGVVRQLEHDMHPFTWTEVPAPAFSPQIRQPSGLQTNEIVYASFGRHDLSQLAGRVISLAPVDGLWSGRLIGPDGDAVSFDATVEDDGSFALQDEAFESFSDTPAIQIVLTRDSREARGWVQNEMLLAMSVRRRLSPSAIRRMIGRNALDEDIEALLDYLSLQADKHLRIFERPIASSSGDSPSGAAAELVTVNLADLAPTQEEDLASSVGLADFDKNDAFDVAMLRLRKMLLGQGRAKRGALSSASDDEADPDQSTAAGGSKNLTEKLGLNNFEREIDALIEGAEDQPRALQGLLSLSLEIGMWFRLYRLNSASDAHDFLSDWFYKACNLSSPEKDSVSSLQQHIFTAAATLMLVGQQTGSANLDAIAIHSSLERYVSGSVDASLAKASLLPEDAGFAQALLGEITSDDLLASLDAVLAHPTFRQQLKTALSLAAANQEIPAGWDVFQSPIGKELHATLSSPNPDKRVRAAPRGSPACAFQQYSFGREETYSFEKLRIARCIHCKKFTLNLEP